MPSALLLIPINDCVHLIGNDGTIEKWLGPTILYPMDHDYCDWDPKTCTVKRIKTDCCSECFPYVTYDERVACIECGRHCDLTEYIEWVWISS